MPDASQPGRRITLAITGASGSIFAVELLRLMAADARVAHIDLVVSDAARIELRRQKTQVVGVYAGYIDTDMAASIDQPKTPPRQIADRALDGVEKRADHVHADARSEEVWRQTRENPAQLAQLQQLAWETRPK